MTCEPARGELSRLLDDELTADDAREVRTHLEACPGCRQEFEALSQLSAVLATSLEPDPGFIVRFRDRRDEAIADVVEWRVWRRLALRLAPLAAAAVFGTATGFWLSAPSQPSIELTATEAASEFVELGTLEMLEWGTDQAFATEEVMVRPVLHIAMEPFPEGEP
jgi:anti-sigma factor RsiW